MSMAAALGPHVQVKLGGEEVVGAPLRVQPQPALVVHIRRRRIPEGAGELPTAVEDAEAVFAGSAHGR